jgi:insertion element IS1 protein InsB
VTRDGGDKLQALRRSGVREERGGARPSALPLLGLRLQFHRHAAARQATGDEGHGDLALRDGQCELRHDRAAVGREQRRRDEVGSPRGHDSARADDPGRGRDRADRRDVAFRERKKNKRWVWRAFDPLTRRTLAWVLGDRDDQTCKRLLAKIGISGRIFLTDDREGYHRCIPAAQLFTGKDPTFGIEQDNGNIRHYLAPFRRRSKVTSRSDQMVDLSLRMLHHLTDPTNYMQLQRKIVSIFGWVSHGSDGHIVTLGTHVSSGKAYGTLVAPEKALNSLANLMRGRMTVQALATAPMHSSVSGGSILSSSLVTALTLDQR